MQIEELTTIDHLERLRPEWTDLWRRTSGATPFQSPAWLIPWWRHIGEGDLHTVAIRADDRLVGLAPFYIYTQENGRRDVFLLGIGTSDYLDVLADREYQNDVLAAALSYLDDIRKRWDVCDFQQLRPDSPLVSAMAPSDWNQELAWQEVCPVLWLDSQPACYEPPSTSVRLSHPRDASKLPQKMLENVRYYQRRLAKLGNVTYEEAGEENLYELFYALLDLHAARWSTKGESGVLWVAPVQMAHHEALPELLSLGILRLYGLRLDGRIVAVLYALADPDMSDSGRVYYYLSGFDPEFEPHSPGTLIIAHALFEAQRSGACAFDFLRGKEEYKYRWGAVNSFTYRRQLRAPK